MARPGPPLWLSRPSRFAGWSSGQARAALALLVLLLVATLTALAAPAPPAAAGGGANRADDRADVMLYDTIVAGVRGGGNYYDVAERALRDGNYPTRPFVTFRLPSLALVQAALPRSVTIVLLYLLAALVMVAWAIRLRPALARDSTLVIAVILLAGGMVAFVQVELVGFHEVWAALFIALSLALRKPGRWVESIAFALCALLMRETAALYVAVMAILAWAEGERREAAGWIAITALFAVVVAVHAHAVAQVVGPLDHPSPGWDGLLGFGFFVEAVRLSTALAIAPLWLAAPLVGLSLFGWAAWRDPLGLRALAIFAVYAALIGVAGRVDTFYWGLLVAPTLLVGLVFVPDGLRDLWRSAIDRRRITVTRGTR